MVSQPITDARGPRDRLIIHHKLASSWTVPWLSISLTMTSTLTATLTSTATSSLTPPSTLYVDARPRPATRVEVDGGVKGLRTASLPSTSTVWVNDKVDVIVEDAATLPGFVTNHQTSPFTSRVRDNVDVDVNLDDPELLRGPSFTLIDRSSVRQRRLAAVEADQLALGGEPDARGDTLDHALGDPREAQQAGRVADEVIGRDADRSLDDDPGRSRDLGQ